LPEEKQRVSPDKAGSNPYTWANTILSLCTSSDTLRSALRAVCLSCLGFREGNQDFIRKGGEFYGIAVSNLTQLLQKRQYAGNVALIPIAMLLATYDVCLVRNLNFDSSWLIFLEIATNGFVQPMRKHQARSWQAHTEGITHILLARSPETHAQGHAHDVFLWRRLAQFIQALTCQRATPLANPVLDFTSMD
jgi:hypothetical protein